MSMNVDCPKCGRKNNDIGEWLPDRSCDDTDYDCVYCGHTCCIGWVAEVEIRNSCLDKEKVE